MKLYVISSGTAPDMPQEALASTGGKGDPKAVVPIPAMVCLIEHPDGLILYDTGWSRPENNPRPWAIGEDELLLNSLARLGVRPADIKYVVCSHLHLDHAGNLDYFTDSEIIVSEPEFINVAKLYFMKKLGGHYVLKDADAWVRLGLHWKLIPEADQPVEFLEGIRLLSFGPGHSYGMLGLLLELPKTGNVILTSDAIYCSENVGPPVRLPGVIQDPAGYTATMNRLLALAKEYNAQLWFGHDMAQFKGLIKSDAGFYE